MTNMAAYRTLSPLGSAIAPSLAPIVPFVVGAPVQLFAPNLQATPQAADPAPSKSKGELK
ncbi:MAG: hypothetical protein ACYC0C_13420 [Devosia sp.]